MQSRPAAEPKVALVTKSEAKRQTATEPNCTVEVQADGTGIAVVSIPPEIMSRIRSRAGTQDLGIYLWQNVFFRSLSSHVY